MHLSTTRKKSNSWVTAGTSICTVGIVLPAMNIVMRCIIPRIHGLPGTRGVTPDVTELLMMLLVTAVFLPIGITLILVGRKRSRVHTPIVLHPCPDCGYELAGLDEPKRCPECSYELNPELIPIPGWGKKPTPGKVEPQPSQPAEQA
jgi:hypothetical protein